MRFRKSTGEWIIYWSGDPWTEETAAAGNALLQMVAWTVGSRGFGYANAIMSVPMRDTYNNRDTATMGVVVNGEKADLVALEAAIADLVGAPVDSVETSAEGIPIPKGVIAIDQADAPSDV